MKIKKRRLFEDLFHAGHKPGEEKYLEAVQEFLKNFFIVNSATSNKTLDEIEAEAKKFSRRVREYWRSPRVQAHFDRMPLDGDFFSRDIVIVPERTQFVEVQGPPSPRASRSCKPFDELGRSSQFNAAAAVRASHSSGAILKASYGAAKAAGQADLAKVIKESAIHPDAASKAAEGLTAKSKHIFFLK